jgi:hypothetical protein
MGWATFRATFSQTHLVTQLPIQHQINCLKCRNEVGEKINQEAKMFPKIRIREDFFSSEALKDFRPRTVDRIDSVRNEFVRIGEIERLVDRIDSVRNEFVRIGEIERLVDRIDSVRNVFGRIFAHWAFIYFGHFIENYKSSPLFLLKRLCIKFDKKGFGYIHFGQFFSQTQLVELLLCLNFS